MTGTDTKLVEETQIVLWHGWRTENLDNFDKAERILGGFITLGE